MSPLLRDRLFVYLAPERLTAVRVGKGLRPVPIMQCTLPLESDPDKPWTPGIEAMDTLLEDATWKTACIELILSSRFLQYAVVPGDKKIRNAAEREALGKIIFRKTFGNLCEGWSLTVSEAPMPAPTLGAATPSEFLNELDKIIGRKARILSIRPDLMEVFNRINRSLKRNPIVIAILEPGKATIAQADQGAWKSIASRVVPANDPESFSRVLEEEAVLRPFADTAKLLVRDLTGTAVMPARMMERVRAIPARWLGQSAYSFLP